MTRKNMWSLLVMVLLGVGISWYSLRNVNLSNMMTDIATNQSEILGICATCPHEPPADITYK